ncbi:MAG: ABC transporter permease [Rhodothermales bacterium]|nr:ABC transporter permease [Rhodothermales bacterium]
MKVTQSNNLWTIVRYQLNNALRSRWVLFHGLLYFVLAEGLLVLTGSSDKSLLSMVNVVLLLTPLISLMFGTIHLYNERSFILLMLTQPIKRRLLFTALFVGLAAPLAGTFALGMAVPFAIHVKITGATLERLLLLIGSGALLTLIFTALAFLIAVRQTDRIRGVGVALIVWLAFAVVYDGLILVVVSTFAAYPVEKPLLALMMGNPIDLARIIIMMSFDAGALMGYTGAVFTRFFGSIVGTGIAFTAMAIWTIVPYRFAGRAFRKQDF